jgi:hypothetical protein
MLLLLTWCAVKRTVASVHSSEVRSVIGTISDDIAQERYEKVYNEASELWKHDATPQQSDETLKLLHTKLGRWRVVRSTQLPNSKTRVVHLRGRAFIVTYQTKFELGEAMETFTLVEENGRWKLARYLVNSTALK